MKNSLDFFSKRPLCVRRSGVWVRVCVVCVSLYYWECAWNETDKITNEQGMRIVRPTQNRREQHPARTSSKEGGINKRRGLYGKGGHLQGETTKRKYAICSHF